MSTSPKRATCKTYRKRSRKDMRIVKKLQDEAVHVHDEIELDNRQRMASADEQEAHESPTTLDVENTTWEDFRMKLDPRLDPESKCIEFSNVSHPDMRCVSAYVREVFRSMWDEYPYEILMDSIMSEASRKIETTVKLGVQVARELGNEELAGRFAKMKGDWFQGVHKMMGGCLSQVRSSSKNVVGQSLCYYELPPSRSECLEDIRSLLQDKKYLWPEQEVGSTKNMYHHKAIIVTIAGLLYGRLPPSRTSIAKKKPEIFHPPDGCRPDEYEIPSRILCNAASLVHYALDNFFAQPNGHLPNISGLQYVKDFSFHLNTMKNLEKNPKLRHKVLHRLYLAVQK
ncbi:hypothetical protein ACEPAI_7395 [Sanghuangporus weigelae]